jgi:UDP-N-acetylmuramoyl-L-alanyl-D-glutamate--2,6-diaminopimelate ligase
MNSHIEKALRKIERLVPRKIYKFFQPTYHFVLALVGAIIYRYPAREIHVIAVTGTKGKSTTTEFVNAILEEAGYKTAILSTIRFKIADHNKPNMYKMTMPGRFFVQKFLREAADAGCQYAIVEMTSEGAKMWRHAFTALNTLIFTNLTPEHIESHGSFEKYRDAKLSLARAVARSWKQNTKVIANADDKHGPHFLIYNVDQNIPYFEKDAKKIKINIPGEFNKVNALAAATFARSIGISEENIVNALAHLTHVPGRVEEINAGQDFKVVVDYAHTADSLEKLYKTYKGKKIAVLGSCGGGRDKSKRPILGSLADKYCEIVIVTDEDPYDDEIDEIINDVASGVTTQDPIIERDRRTAIRLAITKANSGDTILITGKGTDPYIMRANGEREIWSDSRVAREELEKFLATK